jgi:hypothetical protein
MPIANKVFQKRVVKQDSTTQTGYSKQIEGVLISEATRRKI